MKMLSSLKGNTGLRGVMEAIFGKRNYLLLNRGGGLQVHLSLSYHADIASMTVVCEQQAAIRAVLVVWLAAGPHFTYEQPDSGVTGKLVNPLCEGIAYKIEFTCNHSD